MVGYDIMSPSTSIQDNHASTQLLPMQSFSTPSVKSNSSNIMESANSLQVIPTIPSTSELGMFENQQLTELLPKTIDLTNNLSSTSTSTSLQVMTYFFS